MEDENRLKISEEFDYKQVSTAVNVAITIFGDLGHFSPKILAILATFNQKLWRF
jgi:hypothetical protein